MSAAGIPVLREGNVLVLPKTTLEVVEACSGIRSLVSLLTLALILGKLAEPRRWAASLIALAAIPIAIVANAARVAGTGLAARSGPVRRRRKGSSTRSPAGSCSSSRSAR